MDNADTDTSKLEGAVGDADTVRLAEPLNETELEEDAVNPFGPRELVSEIIGVVEGESLRDTLGESLIELEGVAEGKADIETDSPEEKEREM